MLPKLSNKICEIDNQLFEDQQMDTQQDPQFEQLKRRAHLKNKHKLLGAEDEAVRTGSADTNQPLPDNSSA